MTPKAQLLAGLNRPLPTQVFAVNKGYEPKQLDRAIANVKTKPKA